MYQSKRKRQNITDCSTSQFEVQDPQTICPVRRTDSPIEIENIMVDEDIVDFLTVLADHENTHD